MKRQKYPEARKGLIALPWVLCRISKRLHRAELLPLPILAQQDPVPEAGAKLLCRVCLLGGGRKIESNWGSVWEAWVRRWGLGMKPSVTSSYLDPLLTISIFFTANFTLLLFIQRTFVESSLCARYCWVNFAKTQIWTHSLSVWERRWLPLACLVNAHILPVPRGPSLCLCSLTLCSDKMPPVISQML